MTDKSSILMDVDYVIIECEEPSDEENRSIQKLRNYLPDLRNKLNIKDEEKERVFAACLLEQENEALKMDRDYIVLWRRPNLTLRYFYFEILANSSIYREKLMKYRMLIFSAFLMLCGWFFLKHIDGSHLSVMNKFEVQVLWCLYWLGLGVLSSVGLGSGLHTFLLYLGPHIAKVTLAAHECGGLNFPEPPYPDQILCPYEVDSNYTTSIWNIILKVKLEAVMWGAGTALGELPPYFMARAARLSNCDLDEDKPKRENAEENLGSVDRWKLMVEKFVHKVGFFGILACASIPNPLFDLAGITCGHFLVPFWKFFGATLIGKSVIKISVQTIVVIIAFNDTLISKIMSFLVQIPIVGTILQGLITDVLTKEKRRLHQSFEDFLTTDRLETSAFSKILEVIILFMVAYFLVTVVNSMAQNYHKRLNKLGTKYL